MARRHGRSHTKRRGGRGRGRGRVPSVTLGTETDEDEQDDSHVLLTLGEDVVKMRDFLEKRGIADPAEIRMAFGAEIAERYALLMPPRTPGEITIVNKKKKTVAVAVPSTLLDVSRRSARVITFDD